MVALFSSTIRIDQRHFDKQRGQEWKRMIEIGMPLEYRAVVPQLYEEHGGHYNFSVNTKISTRKGKHIICQCAIFV